MGVLTPSHVPADVQWHSLHAPDLSVIVLRPLGDIIIGLDTRRNMLGCVSVLRHVSTRRGKHWVFIANWIPNSGRSSDCALKSNGQITNQSSGELNFFLASSRLGGGLLFLSESNFNLLDHVAHGDRVDHVQALGDVPEDGVRAVQLWGCLQGDVELAAARHLARIALVR